MTKAQTPMVHSLDAPAWLQTPITKKLRTNEFYIQSPPGSKTPLLTPFRSPPRPRIDFLAARNFTTTTLPTCTDGPPEAPWRWRRSEPVASKLSSPTLDPVTWLKHLWVILRSKGSASGPPLCGLSRDLNSGEAS